MDQKKVKTEGTLKDMAKVTDLDQQTIKGAIEAVEQAANVKVEIPKEK